ncbi:hypothetical protein J6590_010123 [Homalodisca vitripennis]|nr:hypothetical protein J6590_010123 [Homalodisca vitripennis]
MTQQLTVCGYSQIEIAKCWKELLFLTSSTETVKQDKGQVRPSRLSGAESSPVSGPNVLITSTFPSRGRYFKHFTTLTLPGTVMTAVRRRALDVATPQRRRGQRIF